MNHLLLIDDDSELCTMLAEYLATEDFTVDMAHDGSAGLNLARRQAYDAIILDVMLPGLNGFDVLRELRQQQQTPVLMLTARGPMISTASSGLNWAPMTICPNRVTREFW